MAGGNECQAKACAIQDCLTKNKFDDSKCQDAVRALYRCCDDLYKRAEKEGVSAEEAKSDSCPLPNVVKRKLAAFDKA